MKGIAHRSVSGAPAAAIRSGADSTQGAPYVECPGPGYPNRMTGRGRLCGVSSVMRLALTAAAVGPHARTWLEALRPRLQCRLRNKRYAWAALSPARTCGSGAEASDCARGLGLEWEQHHQRLEPVRFRCLYMPGTTISIWMRWQRKAIRIGPNVNNNIGLEIASAA